jgi:hypothetical protein
MVFVVPLGLLASILILGRVGNRSATPEFPLVWPSTEYLGTRAEQRRPAILILLASFVFGLAIGAGARAWMRLIAPHPEFTWPGTLFIMIGFGLLFTGAGLCVAAHRNGWRRWALGAARVTGCILILPAFGAAGALAFPSVIFGALAVARWDLRIPLRVLLASLAIVATVFVAVTQIPDYGLSDARAVIGVLLYPVLLWPMLLAARLPLVRVVPIPTKEEVEH